MLQLRERGVFPRPELPTVFVPFRNNCLFNCLGEAHQLDPGPSAHILLIYLSHPKILTAKHLE